MDVSGQLIARDSGHARDNSDTEPDKDHPGKSAADMAHPGDAKPREADTLAEAAGHEAHPDSAMTETQATRRTMTLSVTPRGLVYALLVGSLVGALGIFAWLYFGARSQLAAQAVQSENNGHAEKVALDYATNAAAMNFQDLNGWKANLVAGTSPELKDKLTKAATSMEQILAPLNWVSTAQPLAAKVHSNNGGVYTVDCFVSVQTKTLQGPDPLQSTATYNVVIDSNKGWQITDVGGISGVVGHR